MNKRSRIQAECFETWNEFSFFSEKYTITDLHCFPFLQKKFTFRVLVKECEEKNNSLTNEIVGLSICSSLTPSVPL